MNDATEQIGLGPSRLAFGIIPGFFSFSSHVSNQKERMEPLETAQCETSPIVADKRVLEDLKRNIPLAAEQNYNLGGEILA